MFKDISKFVHKPKVVKPKEIIKTKKVDFTASNVLEVDIVTEIYIKSKQAGVTYRELAEEYNLSISTIFNISGKLVRYKEILKDVPDIEKQKRVGIKKKNNNYISVDKATEIYFKYHRDVFTAQQLMNLYKLSSATIFGITGKKRRFKVMLEHLCDD